LDIKKRFTEEQIFSFLGEAESGFPVAGLCRRHGFSKASYYLWHNKFGGMNASDAKCLKELEAENARLKRLLAGRGRASAAASGCISGWRTWTS
jgi:putative transposase